MWVALVLFGLLLLACLGGVSGRGLYDSRDPSYSLRLPVPSAETRRRRSQTSNATDMDRARA